MPSRGGTTGSQTQPNAGRIRKDHQAPKKPRMSDEAWDTVVATFQSVVDDEASDDRTIQQAWSTLRREYGNRFDAKVLPHQAAQLDFQPFSLWAVDHLNANVLERVLRVVFAKELAGCDHMSFLRSTASLGDTTLWHLILHFGVTVFSENLLGHVRKRIRVFEKDPVTGIWAFPDRYTRALRAAAQRLKIIIDSTAIPCPTTGRIFTKPDLTVLASANPEFDKTSQRKSAIGGEDIRVQGESSSANVASNVVGNKSNENQTTTSINAKFASGFTKRNAVLPSIEPASPRKSRPPPGRAATRSRRETKRQRVHSPSVPPEGQPCPDATHSARRNPQRKAKLGRNAIPPMLDPKLEGTDDVVLEHIAAPPGRLEEPTGLKQQPRALSTIYVWTDEAQSVSSKRPFEEEAGKASAANADRAKRVNKTACDSAFLEQDKKWDDDTIVHILNRLAATCPGKWTVVDGMRDRTTSPPIQLRGEDGEKGFLLVPLKFGNEQRALAVVNLKPRSNSKRGVIQYYDAAGPPYEDAAAEYKPVVILAQLLSNVLPGLNLDRAEWETEHCVFPRPVSEQDGGLAICLAAMYVVGGRPLPGYWDWHFMRHLLRGGFFPDDGAVQFRARHYRDRVIRKLIRQGKMPDDLVTNRGREASPEETEDLGTTGMNTVDRIDWREENSRKIITAIHEGYKVFQTLQEHVDMGKASFRARVDKYSFIQRDLRCKLKVNSPDLPPKAEDVEHTEESFNRTTLQQATKEHALCQGYLKGLETAGSCVQNALYILIEWRRLVSEAVMEEDQSLLMKSIE